MAKLIHDNVLDAALNYIKSNGTEFTVCGPTEPTTYTEAHTTYKLADIVTDSADFTGPADDTSGRKITTVQQTDVPVDATGEALFVCINNTAGSLLLLKTTRTSQSLTSGNTVTIPAFKDNIADPT